MLAQLRHLLLVMAMVMETQMPVKAKAAVVMVVVVTTKAMGTVLALVLALVLAMATQAMQATHKTATLATPMQATDAGVSARTATSFVVHVGQSSSALGLSR